MTLFVNPEWHLRITFGWQHNEHWTGWYHKNGCHSKMLQTSWSVHWEHLLILIFCIKTMIILWKMKIYTTNHFCFEYPLFMLQIFSINIRENTQYLLVNEIWRPRLRTPCLRSCPGARSRACGGWGKRGASEGCDTHNPSLCHQRTTNGDPQLSKDRFEQLPGQLSGIWPSA